MSRRRRLTSLTPELEREIDELLKAGDELFRHADAVFKQQREVFDRITAEAPDGDVTQADPGRVIRLRWWRR